MSRPGISALLTTAQITEIFYESNEGNVGKIHDLFLFSTEISDPAAKKEFLKKVFIAYQEYAASQNKRISEIEEIELTTDGANILHFAIKGGDIAIEFFLPHIDLQNENEIDILLASEILVMAATNGWNEALEILLSRSDLKPTDRYLFHTNPEAFTNLQKTLLLAVAHEHKTCVEILLRAGMAPNVAPTISTFSTKEIIYSLLNAGIDVDKADENGFTFF